jgi:Mitochondrial carrier protein
VFMVDAALESTIKASAIAGVAARVILHPIDTLKSKVQANDVSSVKVVARKILKSPGIFKELYKGFPVAALGSIPGVTLYFTSFQISQRALSKNLPSSVPSPMIDFLSGISAEAVSCIFWVPVDVLKEQKQVKNVGITQFLRSRSVGSLYKGYFATLAAFGPFSALYFTFAEYLKRNQSSDRSFSQLAAICATSGAAAAFLTTPLDLVKLRMQVDFKYGTVYSGLKGIYETQGVRGLFKGGVPRVVFNGLNTAVTMGLMEWLKIRYFSH